MNWYLVMFILTVVIIAIFLADSFTKSQKQHQLYKQALHLARTTNKPLLVIGNPGESNTNYWFGKYGCGDICIDITGCDCDSPSVKIIKNKLEYELSYFEDDSVVIFESEVLEYVDDDKIDEVIQDMYRISNKNIFSVHELKPNSIITKIKQFGYVLFNQIMGRQTFDYKRLFNKYPPENDYKIASL